MKFEVGSDLYEIVFENVNIDQKMNHDITDVSTVVMGKFQINHYKNHFITYQNDEVGASHTYEVKLSRKNSDGEIKVTCNVCTEFYSENSMTEPVYSNISGVADTETPKVLTTTQMGFSAFKRHKIDIEYLVELGRKFYETLSLRLAEYDLEL